MFSSLAKRTCAKRAIALKRTIATAHSKTQYTQLSNGITVATESNSASKSATIGLYYGAGSTSENPYNNGVSNLINKVLVKENEVEALKGGFKLGAETYRDFSTYYAQGLKGSIPQALELLNAKVANAEFSNEAAILHAREVAVKEAQAFEEFDHNGRVLEHLHATAFQNTPLGLPIKGTEETLSTLVKYDLDSFYSKNFVDSNAVVVATGDVDHADIVELVEKKLKLPSGKAPEVKKPKFLGSEVRLRDDTLPKAYISIAAKGEPLNSPNYYVAKVAAQIFGSFNYSEPISKRLGVKLNGVINETHLADKYNHFSLSYKDSGLWGFSTEISNIHQIDDLVHFVLKEWNRLSISITDAEVVRGKQLLKNSILFELSTPLAVAHDIGAKVIGQGRRPSSDEIFQQIEKVDAKAIKAWAGNALWDQDIAVAGAGPIEDLLDYMRMRNEMSMMRW